MQRLSVKGMALAAAILWGLGILFAGIASIYGWGSGFVQTFGSFYIGYKSTIAGAFIGLAWGFFDGLIAGAIFAWLYNIFSGVKK